LKEIGTSAFGGCTSLTTIQLPDTLETIGINAFSGCSSLASINIPVSVTSVNRDSFIACPNLHFEVAAGHPNFSTDQTKAMLIRDGTKLVSCQSAEHANIPEGVTVIGEYAFSGRNKVTSVTFPASLITIESTAFRECGTLASVDLSKAASLTSIGSSAFNQCSTLASVDLSKAVSLTSIGSSAFNQCSTLASVDLPEAVTSIGRSAFAYCRSLVSLTLGAATPPSLDPTWSLYETATGLVIYVPPNSVETYKADANWSPYADKIKAIEN
jgi:hypothetical protein